VYTFSGSLRVASPFDFQKSLDFVGEFPPMTGEQTLGAGSLTRAVYVNGQLIGFRVEVGGTVESPSPTYVLFAEQPITPDTRAAAVDRITFFLSLTDDLRPFYALGEADPDFAPVIARLYGHHQVKFVTPFENAVWAILTQRNPMPIAGNMKAALVEAYGGSITIEGVVYNAFPDAARLAQIPVDELAERIHHPQKAEYLHAAAVAFAAVDEKFLRTGDHAAVEAWLRAIKGIGPWSATFVLIRGLGRTAQLSTEKRLLAAASDCYHRPLAEADLAKIAEHYGDWKGYWAYYLRNMNRVPLATAP
jgi:DNA-3-methyladenine glycosylase II